MSSKIKPVIAEMNAHSLRFDSLKDYGESFWVRYTKRMRPTRQAITVTNVKTKKVETIEISDGEISTCLRMPLEYKKWQENIVKIVTVFSFFRKKLGEGVEKTRILKSAKLFSEEDLNRLSGAITTVFVFSKVNREEDIHVPRDIFNTATGFYLYANGDNPKDCRVYLNAGAGELTHNDQEKQRTALELVTGTVCQKFSRKQFGEESIEAENRILNLFQNAEGIVKIFHATICDQMKFVLYQQFSSHKLFDRNFIGSLPFSGLVKIMKQLLKGLETISQHGIHGRICPNAIGVSQGSEGYEAWIRDFGGFEFLKRRRIRRGRSDVEVLLNSSAVSVKRKTKSPVSPKTSSIRSKSPSSESRSKGSSNRVSSPIRRASSPSQYRRKKSMTGSLSRAVSPIARTKSPQTSHQRTKSLGRQKSPSSVRMKSPSNSKNNNSASRKDAKRPGKLSLRSPVPSRTEEFSPSRMKNSSKKPLTARTKSPAPLLKSPHERKDSSPTSLIKKSGPLFLRPSHTLSDVNRSGPVFLKPDVRHDFDDENFASHTVVVKPSAMQKGVGPIFLTAKSIADMSQMAPKARPPSEEALKKKDVQDLGSVFQVLLDVKHQLYASKEEFKLQDGDQDDEKFVRQSFSRLKELVQLMTESDVEKRCDATEAAQLFKQAILD